MSDENENLVETIEFRAIAPKSDLKGLDAALSKLNALDTALKTVQNRLAGLTTGSAFKLSAAQFTSKIPTSGAQDVKKLAKLWGFPDVKDVQNVAREIEGELQRSIDRIQRKLDKTPRSPSGSTRAQEALRQQIRTLRDQSLFTDPSASSLRNPTRAGQFAELYAKRALVNRVDAEKAIVAMLSGSVPATATGTAGFFPVQPPVKPVFTPAAAKDAAPKADKAARTASGKFADAMEKIKLQLAQDLNTGDLSVVASARAKASDQVRALVDGDDEGKIKQRTKDRALRYAADQERQSVQTSQQVITSSASNVFDLRKKLAAAEKAGQKEKARQLQLELDVENQRVAAMKQLNQVFYKPLAKQNAQRQKNVQAAALLAQQAQAAQLALAAQHATVQDQWQKFMAIPGAQETARSGRMTLGKDGQWTRMLEGQRRMPDGRLENFRADIGRNASFTRGFTAPPTKHDRLTAALGGLNLRDMTANVIKVTTWATAVGVLYKSMQLAEYSMERMEETGMKMAHLSIVFRGVGGDAQALTNDTIKLAAEQGRSTDEAMESAVEWSRLGGDRKAVNEEVRVSAMAANIADISMMETTKQLSALMHIYHLEAGDLNGVLGMLTNTSLKYNVTLDEMFIGLDRSAAAAKVAGVGLAELQAMIGVVVGGTGQTGSMTGNSIKYILQQLNKDDVQKQLRGFGVETLTNNLEKKPAGQTLSELAGIWGTLGQREQGSLSGVLGGRFNAARIPIVLENYPKILQLAIDGQLHLNAAQEANVKILDTLKANLAGLRAEWDAFVMNSGTMPFLSESAEFGKNILHDTTSLFEGPKADAVHQKKLDKRMSTMSWSNDWLELLGNTVMPLPDDPGMFNFYNFKSRTPVPAGQDDFETKRADQQASMKATALRLQQFTLAKTQLSNGTMTDENANIFAETMQPMKGGQAMATGFLNGSPDARLAMVAKARAQTLRDMADEKAASMVTDKEQQDKLLKQKSSLDASIKLKESIGVPHADETKELDAVNAALEKNKSDVDDLSESYQEYIGELDAVFEQTQKYISLLKMQEDTMGRISTMGSLVKANTPLGAMQQQAATAKTQLDFLKGQLATIDANPSYDQFEKIHVKTQINDEIKKAQASFDSNTDPFELQQAQRQGLMERGVRTLDREASGQNYGYDDTQKLTRERSFLNQKVAGLGGINRDDEQEGELREAQNRLFENTLALRQRQVDVEREIKQLAIDQNKEFTKSFMGAGPAEMLQKLAAFRMSFDGKGNKKGPMSQGEFFAMSPGMRGDYGQLNPQYDPEMMRLKKESLEIAAAVKQMNDVIRGVSSKPVPPTHAVSKDTGKDAPKNALLDIANSIATGGNTLIGAFLRLETRVDKLFTGTPGHPSNFSRPVNAQSGGNGGGRGFTR